jgi:hypothetical protein
MPVTEIHVVGGGRYRVDGAAKDVERLILSAARGSIMELVWLTDIDAGAPIGINPEYVIALRLEDGAKPA